jgi:Fe-S-cluster containining protein
MTVENSVLPSAADPLGFMAKATPQLRSAIDRQQALLAAGEFAEMLTTLRRLFEKYLAKLQEFPAGAERAAALHQLMDRELKAAVDLPVQCHRGCSGCCHYEVEITRDEAVVLRDLVLGGFPIDHDRLERQAARARKSPEWLRFGHPDNRCVFLTQEGACGIYEDRPAICRKHLVVTPVAACTTPGATVAPVQLLLAEILLSAELSLVGDGFGSLPRMLAEALREHREETAREPDETHALRAASFAEA